MYSAEKKKSISRFYHYNLIRLQWEGLTMQSNKIQTLSRTRKLKKKIEIIDDRDKPLVDWLDNAIALYYFYYTL